MTSSKREKILDLLRTKPEHVLVSSSVKCVKCNWELDCRNRRFLFSTIEHFVRAKHFQTCGWGLRQAVDGSFSIKQEKNRLLTDFKSFGDSQLQSHDQTLDNALVTCTAEVNEDIVEEITPPASIDVRIIRSEGESSLKPSDTETKFESVERAIEAIKASSMFKDYPLLVNCIDNIYQRQSIDQ